ncbi:MAG: glycosyltransferase family 4 protein [Archaeoglobaceae archaeon]
MRVGHFVTAFPNRKLRTEVYGAGRVAYFLSRELAKKGHEVHVFVPSLENLIENQKNLVAHFYKSLLKISHFGYISPKLLFDPLNYDLDVIHLHWDTPISATAALRYVNKRGKPFVVTWHGDWIERYGNLVRKIGVWLANKYLVDKLLSKADVIITPSMHYVEESKFLRNFREKVVEIPNGIDLEAFNIPHSKYEAREILGLDKEKKLVLFLSQLYDLKGPHILLRAIPKIVERHEDAFFVFAGGGNVKKYETLAKELGVDKFVKFTDYIEERLKPLYYKSADVFVLPSIETFEVFPLVLLEASAVGLPMVVSDLRTFRCIIEEGYNGIFTKRGDPESLANAITYLLENEEVREKMGRNAKEKARQYSWDKIAEKYEEVYKKVLS